MKNKYYHVLKVWDYPSMEEAIKSAIEVADNLSRDNWGQLIVLIDKMEDVLQLPSYQRKSLINGVEVSDWDFEQSLGEGSENDLETALEVEHSVEWTKPLSLDKNYRLHYTFTRSVWSKEQIERYLKQYD